MSHFVTLSRYTQQGTARIRESPARLDAAKKAAEKEGGKIHAWYLTMGKYDAVIISISGKSLGVRRPVPDRSGHLEVLHNAPSADFSIGVKPDYNSRKALLFRRLFPHPSYSGRSPQRRVQQSR